MGENGNSFLEKIDSVVGIIHGITWVAALCFGVYFGFCILGIQEIVKKDQAIVAEVEQRNKLLQQFFSELKALNNPQAEALIKKYTAPAK